MRESECMEAWGAVGYDRGGPILAGIALLARSDCEHSYVSYSHPTPSPSRSRCEA